MLIPPSGTFAEGYDPPEIHGDFVHWVFWVMHGTGATAIKEETCRIILPKAVAFQVLAQYGLKPRQLDS
jgi:hypothetical protein